MPYSLNMQIPCFSLTERVGKSSNSMILYLVEWLLVMVICSPSSGIIMEFYLQDS